MELFWEEQKAFTTFPKGLQKITKNVRVISRIDSYNIIRVKNITIHVNNLVPVIVISYEMASDLPLISVAKVPAHISH